MRQVNGMFKVSGPEVFSHTDARIYFHMYTLANIYPIRVTLKTSGKKKDFMIANDTLVRQFKEKLLAHFQCQIDQLVLVFMGRLLKDHETLRQKVILNGHTIYLVIKSKQSSRSLAHSSWDLLINELCHWNRITKGNSSGVYQPAGMSHPVELALFVKPSASQVHKQALGLGSPKYIAMMEDHSTQWLLSTMEFIEFILEHPEMQQLMQQNPEVSHNNSDILWQTLELARNLALIQELIIPAQNLEHPLNPCLHLGVETLTDGNSVFDQNYVDFNNQLLNSTQNPFGRNTFTTLLEGQVQNKVQSLSLSLP
ncbi:LOW QUALITY PROTEIN: ubiquilin-like protein [Rhynchonycteris naso]